MGIYVPLAPVVRENGRWIYQAPAPTDFFTQDFLMRQWVQQQRLEMLAERAARRRALAERAMEYVHDKLAARA